MKEEEEALEELIEGEGWEFLKLRLEERIAHETRRLVDETEHHQIARIQGKILAYRAVLELPRQILQEKRPSNRRKADTSGLESVP